MVKTSNFFFLNVGGGCLVTPQCVTIGILLDFKKLLTFIRLKVTKIYHFLMFLGKKNSLWWVSRCSFPLKSFVTQFLEIVQGAVAMPSDLQGKIGNYCREINWLQDNKSICREFIECEIERLKKKRSIVIGD